MEKSYSPTGATCRRFEPEWIITAKVLATISYHAAPRTVGKKCVFIQKNSFCAVWVKL